MINIYHIISDNINKPRIALDLKASCQVDYLNSRSTYRSSLMALISSGRLLGWNVCFYFLLHQLNTEQNTWQTGTQFWHKAARASSDHPSMDTWKCLKLGSFGLMQLCLRGCDTVFCHTKQNPEKVTPFVVLVCFLGRVHLWSFYLINDSSDQVLFHHKCRCWVSFWRNTEQVCGVIRSL